MEPCPGESERPGAGIHSVLQNLILCLLSMLPPTFWLHSSIQTSLSPPSAADSSKVLYLIASPLFSLALSSKFQRRARAGHSWLWDVKKYLFPLGCQGWSEEDHVQVEDAALQEG